MTGAVANRDALTARIVQVFGSASSLARFCGISRQALNRRLDSACRWSNSHAWWALVLAVDTRIDGLTVEEITSRPVPPLDQLNQVWSLQASVWQVAHVRRNTRRTQIKAANGGQS